MLIENLPELFCEGCGSGIILVLPCSVNNAIKQCEFFMKMHKLCQKKQKLEQSIIIKWLV